MKKIIIFVGTRPEAIKLAPIILELKKFPKIKAIICSTGQHTDLLKETLKVFGITCDYDLQVMQPGQTLSSLTRKIMKGVDDIINKIKPDLAIVHGDTTTCFGAALSCFYNKVKVAHVEAGLRTWDLLSPYPEEANRQLVGVLADLHFCPTEQNRLALLKSGVSEEKISVTGNSVIDALLRIVELNTVDHAWRNEVDQRFDFLNDAKPFILITAHRRESFGDGFIAICEAIRALAGRHINFNFVYPVHPNPQVRDVVYNKLIDVNNIHLIPPLEYRTFVYVMQQSFAIVTDSGGIQEEAPSLRKPVLVIREKTERTEALNAGTVKLIGTKSAVIEQEISKIIENDLAYNEMSNSINPYGNGDSSKLICAKINEYLND